MTTNSLDTFTPDELLQAAVAKGATLQQALQQLVRTFAPAPTAAELAYVRAANKHLGDDTGLKFEDKAPVCIEGKEGAWVQAWVWVPSNLLSPVSALLQALDSPFEQVLVEVDSQDVMDAFTASELLVNDEVRQALDAGMLMPNTWALRGLNGRDQRFELSTKQLEKLVFDDSEGCFNNGKPDNGRIALSFMN